MTSKLKDFLYVGAMQGHSIIHDDGMNSKQYGSPPINSKSVNDLTDYRRRWNFWKSLD